MKRLSAWYVSTLTIAVILASLVCGAFGMSFHMMDSVDHVAIEACSDDICATHDAECLTHCLSRTDAAEERLVIAPVILMARSVLFSTFRGYTQQPNANTVLAPPWQSHRLFAFRE